MVDMVQLSHASSFQIGPKGRSVIPAAVRKAANIAEGDEVVAIALGEGRVLVETVAAVRRRVWESAPTPSETSATQDVREMRRADAAAADAAAVRRQPAGAAADSEARGQALLVELGLDL